MVRKIVCAAALALPLLVPGGAYACEGDDCAAPAGAKKPLDIMQFMREQAASTRVGEQRSHRSSHVAAAKSKPVLHQAVAARPKPAPLPTEAAASFASDNEPPVPVVASSEFNAIGGSAPTAASFPFPETMGAAPGADPGVQVVAAAEFNDIDRKADDASAVPGVSSPLADASPASIEATANAVQVSPQVSPQASPAASWLQWLWSAVTGTFAALSAAVRQLVHL